MAPKREGIVQNAAFWATHAQIRWRAAPEAVDRRIRLGQAVIAFLRRTSAYEFP
jgi:hypothetical protein